MSRAMYGKDMNTTSCFYVLCTHFVANCKSKIQGKSDSTQLACGFVRTLIQTQITTQLVVQIHGHTQ